jgi:hypothetical protein
MTLGTRLQSRIYNSEFYFRAMAVRRFIEDPERHLARRRLARELLRNSAPAHEISHEAGYRVFEPGEFPGTETLVRVCQKLAAEKLAEQSIADISARGAKPFYFNIIHEDDFLAHPEIIEFALSDEVLRTLSVYYGTLPELCFAAILLSSPAENVDSQGTQIFHWDAGDRRHVKFFMNITDVELDNGPLSFLPIARSDYLRNKGLNRWRGVKVRDETVFHDYDAQDLVRLTGRAGTCGFVDTSRCLHYGRRCTSGYRLSLVLHYAMLSEYAAAKSSPYRDFNLTKSPAVWNRFVRDGQPIHKAVYRLKPNP